MKASLCFLGIVVGSLVGSAAFGHPSPLQLPGSPERDAEEKELGVIRGQVLAEDGSHPLAKAILSLRLKTERLSDRPRTVRTDSAGEYTFRDLEPGQYVLRAARNGYIPRNYGQKSGFSFSRGNVGTALTVARGQVMNHIDFRLIRAGVVEGRVVDQDNEPLERVQVMLSGYRNLGGERRLMPFGRDETDDRGQFRIFGVPSGTYLLSASPRPFATMRGGADRSFPPTYYPGVLRVEDAPPTAAPRWLRFHLRPVQPGRLNRYRKMTGEDPFRPIWEGRMGPSIPVARIPMMVLQASGSGPAVSQVLSPGN